MDLKTLGIVVAVAIVLALVVTFVQRALFEESNTAVTGGVVGALSAVVAVNLTRRKHD